jgi:hypothetical protein
VHNNIDKHPEAIIDDYQSYYREGWCGHLWQGQFASFVLDDPYLLTVARYVELNPVRAGLVNASNRTILLIRRAAVARLRGYQRGARRREGPGYLLRSLHSAGYKPAARIDRGGRFRTERLLRLTELFP